MKKQSIELTHVSRPIIAREVGGHTDLYLNPIYSYKVTSHRPQLSLQVVHQFNMSNRICRSSGK